MTLSIKECLSCELVTVTINGIVVVDELPIDYLVEFDTVEAIRQTLHAVGVSFDEELVTCDCEKDDDE